MFKKKDKVITLDKICDYLVHENISAIIALVQNNLDEENIKNSITLISDQSYTDENELVNAILVVGFSNMESSFDCVKYFSHDTGCIDIMLNEIFAEQKLEKALSKLKHNGVYDIVRKSYDENEEVFSKNLLSNNLLSKISRSLNTTTLLTLLLKSTMKKELITEMVYDTDKYRRRACALTLQNHHTDESVDLLIELLNDTDEQVRKISASSISVIKGEAFLKEVLEKQKEDAKKNIRNHF